MRNLKKSSVLWCAFAVATLFLATAVPLAAASEQCEAPAEKAEKIESNAFFEVVGANEVKFRDGVEFEIVQDADGVWSVRYGIDLKSESQRTLAGALECDCSGIGGCAGECTTGGAGTGGATCRGGCYRDNNTACQSCIFREVITTER
ncbi:MAG: hypothetical protein AAF560_15290 [Acidobacteriota bacterium]